MSGPREHRLATPAGDICWFEWGTRSDAPSVLLLHATGFHARVWDRVAAALPAGTHIVAPDHRGHGRSYRPDTLADWGASGDALLPLLDHFPGQRWVGCGHSMGGLILTRLAAERPAAFVHLILVDPVIMPRAMYEAAASDPIADDDHPVARRRARWTDWQAMAAHLGKRLPYSAWQPDILADYCRHGLLPAADGEGWELACPPRLEASVYQNALHRNPYEWLGRISAPVSVIRARSGERANALDFSVSPTWPGLGAELNAVRDEQWAEHSHFIPMEAPERLAVVIAEAGAPADVIGD
ncbi:alpha/beta fold hydrolase [Sphingopyxis sp. MWB1]|uniref:alpha/beta fold hydrolase n=1 Tax=Sphingopyxis sp. MWB1 TaxID=1537715 RepID=UPI00068F08B7|nr:alpha/beta hydrolase [Sphingopyxis sp. MWB1]